jgi:hypothetical protein
MVPEHTPARANPARGLALIASAVIIGIFVLRQGWDDGAGGSVSTGGNPAEQAGEPSDGDTATTPPTQPERPNTEVTVRVFNSTDTGGAAGRLSEGLVNEGWQAVEPTDAPDGWQAEKTEVLFLPGYDQEAATVAGAIGAPADAVKAFPDPLEMDPGGAQILVMLGGDLAGNFAD